MRYLQAFEVAHPGRCQVANRRMMELAIFGHTLDEMTDTEVESFHHSVPLLDRLYHCFIFPKVSISYELYINNIIITITIFNNIYNE